MLDIFDDAGFLPRLKLEIVVFGKTLVAHLVDYAVPLSRGRHQLNFLEGARQRLFGVDMLADRHRRHRDREVRMIRNHDGNGIECVRHFIKQLAPVLIDLRIRETAGGFLHVDTRRIHVA